jgi:bifunctional hydroxylase/dehydrase
VNLGWKLAAVVTGRVGEALLDTYHAERHPVGEALMTNTQAQGLLFLTGGEMEPMREIMRGLLQYPEVRRHLAGQVSGLTIAYGRRDGEHELTGERLPEVRWLTDAGSATTAELLRPGRGLLLELVPDSGLVAAAAGHTDRVDTLTVVPELLAEPLPGGLTGVLVRPDGHVAWAAADGSATGLESALTSWFGPAIAADRVAA